VGKEREEVEEEGEKEVGRRGMRGSTDEMGGGGGEEVEGEGEDEEGEGEVEAREERKESNDANMGFGRSH